MSISRWVSFPAALLLALLSGFVLLSSGQEPKAQDRAEISLTVVKMAQLTTALEDQKGKIVVADIWGTFCVPCKKEFPHLVELHRDLASAGVVCMSVTIDEKDKVEAALKFLREQGATFPNYLLDEDAAVWQEKWAINGVPAVFVFARDGKQAAKFDSDADKEFSYKDVRKKVEELLK